MPAFKGGVSVNTIERCGLEVKYLRVRSGPQRGQYVHRLIAGAMLQRELGPDEEVDHKDGDTFNNHWSNLEVVTCSEHARRTRERAAAKKRAAAAARDLSDVPF